MKRGEGSFNSLQRMRNFMERIKKFLKDEEGVTAIEYGLIAAGIGVAIVAVVFLVGKQLNSLFSKVSGCLARTS
jgi:pilus assembly protein Flp/PilA